jgi:hypothetical protein
MGMAGPLDDRRSGKDRRALTGSESTHSERRLLDRRQFPPPHDSRSISVAAMRLQKAIDAFKKQRGLARLTADELLAVLESLGYREV